MPETLPDDHRRFNLYFGKDLYQPLVERNWAEAFIETYEPINPPGCVRVVEVPQKEIRRLGKYGQK